MKKRILAGLMCVMIVLSLCGCDDGVKIKHNPTNKEAKSAKEIIAFYSRIKIPQNAKLIFYYYHSVFQDGVCQYTVFLFEDECVEWLAENNFNEEKNEIFEKKIVAGIRWLREEQISKFYYPDFTSEYLWLEAKRTYFVYNKDSKALYVLEISGSICFY